MTINAIYLTCFSVGLVFTIFSALFGHLFGGHDAHVDVGTGGHAESGFESDGVPGISVFSPTTLASFITALGGFGMIFSSIDATQSVWVSAPLAVLCATLVGAGVIWLFNSLFRRTESSSESKVAELIGMTATIITPIPANGVGEIAYVHSGSRYSAPARDERGAAIAGGQTVKIIRIVGSQFYVQPV